MRHGNECLFFENVSLAIDFLKENLAIFLLLEFSDAVDEPELLDILWPDRRQFPYGVVGEYDIRWKTLFVSQFLAQFLESFDEFLHVRPMASIGEYQTACVNHRRTVFSSSDGQLHLLFTLQYLPAKPSHLHDIVFVVGYLEESHLHHLQEIVLPVLHADILAHSEGLQLLEVMFDDERGTDAPDDFYALADVYAFVGSDDGTQCLLNQDGAVEGLRWVGAYIAVPAILGGSLSEVVEEDSPSANP